MWRKETLEIDTFLLKQEGNVSAAIMLALKGITLPVHSSRASERIFS